MRNGLAVAVILSIVSPSCAWYTASPVPIPKFEAMPVRQTEHSVAIGLDPFLERDRQKEVFDDDLMDQGVLPIQVFVQNQGDRPILLHTPVLMLPDGTEISHKLPVSPPSGSPPQRSEFCENVAVFGGGMPGPQLLFLLGCGIYGASREGSYQTEMARWQDYSDKELKSVTLGKEIWIHGFVFFKIPEEKRHSTDAMLLFRFTEGDGTGEPERTVGLPVTGLRLK